MCYTYLDLYICITLMVCIRRKLIRIHQLILELKFTYYTDGTAAIFTQQTSIFRSSALNQHKLLIIEYSIQIFDDVLPYRLVVLMALLLCHSIQTQKVYIALVLAQKHNWFRKKNTFGFMWEANTALLGKSQPRFHLSPSWDFFILWIVSSGSEVLNMVSG